MIRIFATALFMIESCAAPTERDMSLTTDKNLFENYTGPKQWLSKLPQSDFTLGEELRR